ncbi:MAG: HNH endonuclease [Thiocapsa sp.]|uniref:HNH endonuclease n=1 Tax=Thiocapsa sp. TaxID=2024551 RepID=UPI001BCBFF9C|nr:HNH endonuclease [Thiocapsa sp.]QVL49071.1 MAG: HNH endonuclease [Thiocapsa sp.]
MNIVITAKNLKNSHFRVESGSGFFPSDSWGGNNRNLAALPIRFIFEGTNEEVDTDIDSRKRIPRHARGQIKRFFLHHRATEGESVVITKIADRQYLVRMARSTSVLVATVKPTLSNPPAGSETPARTDTTSTRIVRETAITDYVKRLYNFECQVCGTALSTQSGPYAEGAHIRPLGGPHDGPDVVPNVLCLCPNHHVMLDGGTLSVREDYSLAGVDGRLTVHADHTIDPAHLKYHRKTIAQIE